MKHIRDFKWLLIVVLLTAHLCQAKPVIKAIGGRTHINTYFCHSGYLNTGDIAFVSTWMKQPPVSAKEYLLLRPTATTYNGGKLVEENMDWPQPFATSLTGYRVLGERYVWVVYIFARQADGTCKLNRIIRDNVASSVYNFTTGDKTWNTNSILVKVNNTGPNALSLAGGLWVSQPDTHMSVAKYWAALNSVWCNAYLLNAGYGPSNWNDPVFVDIQKQCPGTIRWQRLNLETPSRYMIHTINNVLTYDGATLTQKDLIVSRASHPTQQGYVLQWDKTFKSKAYHHTFHLSFSSQFHLYGLEYLHNNIANSITVHHDVKYTGDYEYLSRATLKKSGSSTVEITMAGTFTRGGTLYHTVNRVCISAIPSSYLANSGKYWVLTMEQSAQVLEVPEACPTCTDLRLNLQNYAVLHVSDSIEVFDTTTGTLKASCQDNIIITITNPVPADPFPNTTDYSVEVKATCLGATNCSTASVRLSVLDLTWGLPPAEMFKSDYKPEDLNDGYGVSCTSGIPHSTANPLVQYLLPTDPDLRCYNTRVETYAAIHNNPSYSLNCARTIDGVQCKFCQATFYPDYVATYGAGLYPSYVQCVHESECNTPDNYYYWYEGVPANPNKKMCLSCPSNCSSCDLNGCSACNQGNLLHVTFDAVAKTCNCNQNDCSICRDTPCDACAAGYLHIPKVGNKFCLGDWSITPGYVAYSGYVYRGNPPGTYYVVRQCDVNHCKVCEDDYLGRCLECLPTYGLIDHSLALSPDYSATLTACTATNVPILGLYFALPAYLPCQPNCKLCSNFTDCTECVSGYIFNLGSLSCILSTACGTLGSGSYTKPSHPPYPVPVCAQCLTDCIHCSDIGFCKACVPGTIFHLQQIQCISAATLCVSGSGNYQTTHPFNPSVCSKCIDNCITCSDSTSCITCAATYVYDLSLPACLLPAACVAQVPGHFVSGTSCLDCMADCLLCPSVTWCDQCIQGKIYHTNTVSCIPIADCGASLHRFQVTPFLCQNCKANCKLCSTELNCLECVDFPLKYYVAPDNSTCVPSCEPGSSLIASTTHCTACPAYCNTCGATPSNILVCFTCKPRYEFDEQGNCVYCDPESMVLVNGVCKPCLAHHCLRCVGSQTTCLQCLPQYSLSTAGACQRCDPPNVFLTDGSCGLCPDKGCLQCNKFVLSQCDLCDLGYELDHVKACKDKTFKVVDKSYSQTLSEMNIIFEDSIVEVKLSDLEIRLTDQADLSKMVKFKVISAFISPENRKQLTVRISIEDSILEGTLSVKFKQLKNVASATRDGYVLRKEDEIVSVMKIEVYSPPLNPGLSTLGKVLSGGIGFASFLSLLVSVAYAVALIKIYQMMDFMLLYNVEYPANFKQFLEIFAQGNILEKAPDIFTAFHDGHCPKMGDKFVSQLYSCQLFKNCSDTLLFFSIFGGLKLLSSTLALLFGGHSNMLSRGVNYLNSKVLGFGGLISLIMMFDMTIHTAAFINSKYYLGDKELTFPNLVNVLVANTYIFLFPLVILFLWLKTKLAIDHLNGDAFLDYAAVQSSEFLVSSKKLHSFYQKYVESFKLLRNYCISGAVVCFYDYPAVQIGSTFLVLSLSSALDLKYKVSLSRLENYTEIAVWALYSLCSLLFFILHFADPNLSRSAVYKYFGYPIIGGFILLICANLLPAILTVIWTAIQKIKTKCQKKANTSSNKDNTPQDLGRSQSEQIAMRANDAGEDPKLRDSKMGLNAPINNQRKSGSRKKTRRILGDQEMINMHRKE